MTRLPIVAFATAAALVLAAALPSARAAYVIEIDTDGLDDGVLTFNTQFAFGGDTTTASQSSPSSATGLTGGDSIFGGDGVSEPDTYLYNYAPGIDVDNLDLDAGTALNGSDLATGITGGDTGLYRIYATWPFTENVTGGLTTFSIDHDGGNFTLQLDQNGLGDDWVSIGEVSLTSGTAYTLSQSTETNSFVSMRSSAVMFERVPEPSAALLLAAAGAAIGMSRRRRDRES